MNVKQLLNYCITPLICEMCGLFLLNDLKSVLGGILLLTLGFISGWINKEL